MSARKVRGTWFDDADDADAAVRSPAPLIEVDRIAQTERHLATDVLSKSARRAAERELVRLKMRRAAVDQEVTR